MLTLPLWIEKEQDEYWNYRPVSVLPSLSQIFENVVANQLIKYFKDDFLSYLAAFRKGYSCKSTLLKLLEVIGLDKKHVVAASYSYGFVQSFLLHFT